MFNYNILKKPSNYHLIDNSLSRSAQPQKENFIWLRNQGVTDIVNFRTMFKPEINFNEQEIVESLKMRYHNIPSITSQPNEANIFKFLNLTKQIKEQAGKLHMHCMAGADRTGMYAFIYKILNGIGTEELNITEWIAYGHNSKRYPNLINWAVNFVKNHKK